MPELVYSKKYKRCPKCESVIETTFIVKILEVKAQQTGNFFINTNTESWAHGTGIEDATHVGQQPPVITHYCRMCNNVIDIEKCPFLTEDEEYDYEVSCGRREPRKYIDTELADELNAFIGTSRREAVSPDAKSIGIRKEEAGLLTCTNCGNEQEIAIRPKGKQQPELEVNCVQCNHKIINHVSKIAIENGDAPHAPHQSRNPLLRETGNAFGI